MKILITSWTFAHFSGAELYARDLALALQRRGHEVAVYSPFPGRLADVAMGAGVKVVADLRHLTFVPDLIHGHHQPALLDAMLRFPLAPAIFVVHDGTSAIDEPFASPRIRRYVAVDRRCLARIAGGKFEIPAAQSRIVLNFVDLDRFRPRPPLPARPARALVFSSYATGATHLPAVRQACARLGLTLDVAGRGVGNLVENPENILGRYDLVFAKARCALEAMAVGAAVVLCDFKGLGPMVTSDNFDSLRPRNFGAETLSSPLEPGLILREAERYDAADAASVSSRIRAEARLDRAVEELLVLYREALSEAATARPTIEGERDRLLRLNAKWRGRRRQEHLIEIMRWVRKIPILGGAAYTAWRAAERALARLGRRSGTR